MRIRDFFALMAVCVVWGLNFVVAKFAVAGVPHWVDGFEGVPPFFFTFLRFSALSLVLIPFLKPRPTDIKTLFVIALCMGSLQYSLIFIGLQTATPSGMAIALQTGVPFATILSIFMLREKVGAIRIGGIVVALTGTTIVVANPQTFELSLGLLIGIAAAFVGALGMILVKRMPLDSMRLQAWIGLFSWPPMLILTLVFEQDQIAAMMAGGWQFFAALVFTVGLVNIFGHGVFYNLLQRYDATIIAPLSLMAPLTGVIAGVMLANDPISTQLLVGGGLALLGVTVIALRPNRTLPDASLTREKSL
ncbi:MAG: EamA family transporter [Maricaulis sp.]|nr:EamA family transporter [Maricaulis sp.]MDG2045119.1 EamA family transporter [Maricaulis sp.]